MITERRLQVDVLTAARQRIRNVFSNGLPVYMSFSGGKDSLVLADLTVKLIETGRIDVSRLRVEFIDEEAIFPCVEEIVKQWRARFLLLGARFDWYCLEVRHYSCLNQLQSDESFICWDSTKRDVWVRDPPPFAIRSHPLLKAREDTYQDFLAKLTDGPHMTGVRLFESVQRRIAHAAQKPITDLRDRPRLEPIYDWRDSDVWRYLAENQIEIPAAYMHLYQIGASRKNMRISQFFSVDTAYALARIAAFYPGLMERILRREPAAYLVSLYWDSEMFRRRSPTRRKIEQKVGKTVDARNRVFELLRDIDANFGTDAQRAVARAYKLLILRNAHIQPEHYEAIYDALIAGDPKYRTYRSINTRIRQDAADRLGIVNPGPIEACPVGAPGQARPAAAERL